MITSFIIKLAARIFPADADLAIDLEVTNNITDIKGNKVIIKSTSVLTINLVKETMAQTPYRAIVEEDLPGLRVKIHLPAWMKPFVERDKIVKLIIFSGSVQLCVKKVIIYQV